MIWEPFILALVLGIIVSAGLYFAYLWPQQAALLSAAVDDDQAPAEPAVTAEPAVAAEPVATAEPAASDDPASAS